MEKLTKFNGTIVEFKRSNGIEGHVCITKENKIYAYLYVPKEVTLPLSLELTTSYRCLLTKHGFNTIGFNDDIEEVKEEVKTSSDTRIQLLKKFYSNF